ncbi:MAG: hypothetical protein HZA53_13685 [Planctomycetes bacterium]|nr:hypothetical protein [Planctomycetota bacterium]
MRAEPARLDPGDFEARLLAFDLATGRLAVERVLARGAARVAAKERPNLGITLLAPPTAPLGGDALRLLVSTGLGTLACVDALDGRLAWTVRAARSKPEERPTPGLVAPSFEGELGTWASEDGPYLHRFHSAPLGSPAGVAGLFAETPRPLGGGTFLGAEGGRWLVATGAGRFEELGAESGPRRSLDLGPREPSLPAAVFLPGRAIVVTERALLLLDRERGLAVLDRVELRPGDAGRPVLLHGRIWVLGPQRLRTFRAG